MKATLFILIGLAVAALAQGSPVPFAKNLITVDELDISQYAGRWHQMYGNRYGAIFDGGSLCNTADYKSYNATIITVRNHGRMKTPDGDISEIRGYAIATDEPGQLRLRLGGVPFEGSYWVIKLGPVVNGKYDYSVVSSKGGSTLYVMTRDIFRFEDYRQGILDYLKDQGFTGFFDEPTKMYQGIDCQYLPEETESPEEY